MRIRAHAWMSGLLLWGALVCGQSNAAASDRVVRIEEDWEMVVQSPDIDLDAPQIVMSFSPFGSVEGLHATLEINHISSVLYAAGGLHLSIWNGETHLAVKHAGNYAELSNPVETVSWTHVMEFNGETLSFKIKNGTSDTWGEFGEADGLALHVNAAVENFDDYSPEDSVRESDVSYAGNRVRSLVLKRVRYITESGDTEIDATERVAHQSEVETPTPIASE